MWVRRHSDIAAEEGRLLKAILTTSGGKPLVSAREQRVE